MTKPLTIEEKHMLREIGISEHTFRERVKKGFTREQALTIPKHDHPILRDEAIEIVKRVRRLNNTEYKHMPFSIPGIERIAGMKVNE